MAPHRSMTPQEWSLSLASGRGDRRSRWAGGLGLALRPLPPTASVRSGRPPASPPPAVIPAKAGTQLSPPTDLSALAQADNWVPASAGMTSVDRDDIGDREGHRAWTHPVQNPVSLTRGVTSILRPHTPISSQLTHGPWRRAYTPPHCVLIERLETNGRGRRAGWCEGRLAPGGIERIVRAFPGPGSGADDGHDRPSSRSGWADRRPIPPERRRASTQGSHLSPLTVRAPGSRGGTKGPLLRRTNRLDPWSRLAAPLP